MYRSGANIREEKWGGHIFYEPWLSATISVLYEPWHCLDDSHILVFAYTQTAVPQRHCLHATMVVLHPQWHCLHDLHILVFTYAHTKHCHATTALFGCFTYTRIYIRTHKTLPCPTELALFTRHNGTITSTMALFGCAPHRVPWEELSNCLGFRVHAALGFRKLPKSNHVKGVHRGETPCTGSVSPLLPVTVAL